MEFEVGDLVLCTVDRIVGTTVFVKIENNGEGSIITPEIAPGRIRNLRDYVVPKKTIVCKVLRVLGDRIDLSLRRVSPKERKEVLEDYKQEKSCKSILKSVLGEEAEKLIEEISRHDSMSNFCEKIKIDSAPLEKLVGKEKAKKILEIFKTQKQKRFIIKKNFTLTSKNPDGIIQLKEILSEINSAEINYISAGKFVIKTSSSNPKEADNKLKEILFAVEKRAKKQGVTFSIDER